MDTAQVDDTPGPDGQLWSVKHGLRSLARRFFRFVKWLLILIAALVAVVTLIAFAWNVSAGRDLAAARAAAEARGLRLSASRLSPGGRTLGNEERTNAANYYEAAILAMRMVPPAPEKDLTPIVSRNLSASNSRDSEFAAAAREYKRITDDPRLPLPDYMLTDARAYVAARAQVLDLVRQGAAVSPAEPLEWLPAPITQATTWYHVRWEDGYETLLPHLTWIRQISRTLAVSAWIAAEEGRPSDAVADIRTGLALAKSLNAEPSLISSLVGNACVSIAVQSGLAHAAARVDIPRADLELLQHDLEAAARDLTMYYAYEGELAMGCDFLDVLADGRKTADEILDLGRQGGIDSAPVNSVLSRLLRRIPSFYIRGYVRNDEAYMLRFYQHFFDTITQPPAVFPIGAHPMEQDLEENRLRHVFSAMMLPALGRGLLQGEFCRIKMRAAAAACAAMRYRADRGDWPGTLDTLVPEYMSEVPLDPITGGPLRYLKRDGGIVIYSAGENRRDDDGMGPGLGPTVDKKDVDDVGFRVWK